MKRAYFTGSSVHTTLGVGIEQNLGALRDLIAPPQRATLQLAQRSETVPYYLLADTPLEAIDERMYRVLFATVEAALDAAQLTTRQRRNLALFIGTSSSDISMSEAIFKRDLLASAEAQPLMRSNSLGNVALSLMKHFHLRGADFSINTACTASANALLQADAMIRGGIIERALIVGFEFCNIVTALGFQGLQLLTDDLMRPFDSRRKGLILGEACSALVLDATCTSRDGFYLAGAANLADTHSISAANPDGSTIAKVIQMALDSASVSADDIAAIKVHGTASLLNDEAEVAGMRRVFDELPTLCALKPRIGHTLGACGLSELILFASAAQQGWLPGTPGISAIVGDLGVALNQAPLPTHGSTFMLNYFGFGGNNTSLIIGRGGN